MVDVESSTQGHSDSTGNANHAPVLVSCKRAGHSFMHAAFQHLAC